MKVQVGMKIGIDLHMVNDFMQGSRTYTYNLTRSLIELDSENDYFLYFTEIPKFHADFFAKPNVHIRRIVPKNRLVRLPISFPVKLAFDKIDLFHCQYMAPPVMTTPYVVTLHDILHESHPEHFPTLLRFFMSMCYPFCARRATHVFTVSEYSKSEIIERYRIPEEKISVTYDGVSEEFHKIDDREMIRRGCLKYGISSDYLLFVGRLEPRKNIAGLIRAYHMLRQSNAIRQKLVIAGMKDFMYEPLFATVKRLGLEEDVIFTGRVEQEDLPLVYNGADLFVYPSFAEGFGLPPLEAMACGVPVIASNTTSLPEVVGNAGILVNPYDLKALSEAMRGVLTNPQLSSQLERRGQDRVKKFTWQKTSQVVMSVYQKLV